MVCTRNNPRVDVEASNANQDLKRENTTPPTANQQEETIAHDDNTPVTRHELQGMIGGFPDALNRMSTMMERMAPRLENNPLPQRR